ncbi:MAG: hypothetical protein CM15mV18_0990 [uncultured marine virus]|nr:MAG: hypothetical protein CM15mV18_0990 [uncultured marine virus]
MIKLNFIEEIMSNFKDNSGLETIKPKTQKRNVWMIKKFLDKGGKSTEIKTRLSTNVGSLDKSKKSAFYKR